MDIIDYFKIPEKAIPHLSNNNRIPLKTLIENNEVSNAEKKLIEKSIGAFYIRGIISEDSSSIWNYKDESYEYTEIYIFEVVLKDTSKICQLNELLQKSFQNQCVFVYKYNSKFAISTASKRINLNDCTKNVIDEIILTRLFDLDENHIQLLSKMSYDFKNLKEFYNYIQNMISADEIIYLTNTIPNVINSSVKDKSNHIKELVRQRIELEAEYNNADSIQEKMKIHIKLNNLQKEIESLL